jgi:hypothetical protein
MEGATILVVDDVNLTSFRRRKCLRSAPATCGVGLRHQLARRGSKSGGELRRVTVRSERLKTAALFAPFLPGRSECSRSSLATRKAALAAGNPAYIATCIGTFKISSTRSRLYCASHGCEGQAPLPAERSIANAMRLGVRRSKTRSCPDGSLRLLCDEIPGNRDRARSRSANRDSA